jgi:hypothetical protein
MKRTSNSLIPTDNMGYEQLATIANDELVKVTIVRPRNIRHHRLAFALLQLVFEAQDTYSTLDSMLDAIKLAVGHSTEILGLDGKPHVIPLSISFASLDQNAFKEFYEKMLNVILNKILPNTGRQDLEQRAYEILGEVTPQQYMERR